MLMDLVYKSGIAKKYSLKGNVVLVLLALSNHWNRNRNDAFPHQSLIAERFNMSEKSVVNAITALKKAGLILAHKTQRGNLYKFTQKFLEEVSNLDEKSTPSTGKNYTSQVKNLHLHIEQKKEQININKKNPLPREGNKKTSSKTISYQDNVVRGQNNDFLKEFELWKKEPKQKKPSRDELLMACDSIHKEELMKIFVRA